MRSSRLNETLVAIAKFRKIHYFAPTTTELETFGQVRSRTYGKRVSEAVKAGLVVRTQHRHRCHVTGRKAYRFWLSSTGAQVVGEV